MSDTPTADPENLAKRMGDFSPRLSPMLVKELRQGMRTNMFAIAFILLHTFMMLCLLTAMIDPGSSDSEAFFWFVIIVVLLFVQPLRGFSALSSEYQLNTMDLIHMTKLNGWRITLAYPRPVVPLGCRHVTSDFCSPSVKKGGINAIIQWATPTLARCRNARVGF